jgi:hypothetical protein
VTEVSVDAFGVALGGALKQKTPGIEWRVYGPSRSFYTGGTYWDVYAPAYGYGRLGRRISATPGFVEDVAEPGKVAAGFAQDIRDYAQREGVNPDTGEDSGKPAR